MNFYIARDAEVYGPYSEQQLLEYLHEGLVTKEDFGAREGDEAWQPVSSLLRPRPPQYRHQEWQLGPSGDWHDVPASAKQMARLRYLGFEFPVVITKGYAGSIIDRTANDPAFRERLEEWETEKYRLHPDIYPPELRWMLESTKWHEMFKPPSEYRFAFKRPLSEQIISVLRSLDEREPGWRAHGQNLLEYNFMNELAFLHPDLRKRNCRFPIPGFRDAPYTRE